MPQSRSIKYWKYYYYYCLGCSISNSNTNIGGVSPATCHQEAVSADPRAQRKFEIAG
jgi:hypothetical protein